EDVRPARLAIYPGTFDPITLGHVDVARRAARLFDRVVVAIFRDAVKPTRLFSTDERVAMAREAFAGRAPGEGDIAVDTFSGLAVEYARSRGASAIVRGLRAVSDFEYEFKCAHMNHHLAPDIDVVCLMTSSRHAFVSSSLIREVAMLGGDVTTLVSPTVAAALAERRSATP
ncbi:MAG: pantetheine-phosphate adenylyltransferase, partial [Thermomicrobiales bacterium]